MADTKTILLMGLTGSGRTTFINSVAGTQLPTGGHSLMVCTTEVQSVTYQLDGHCIELVDTPAFDADEDGDCMQKLYKYLRDRKTAGNKVVGIIYTCDITKNRVSFYPFRNLCGDEALKNVVFVTTRWGNINPATEEHNEQALQYKLQHELNSAVAIVRHDNSGPSAKDIVRSLLCKIPVDLALRRSAPGAILQIGSSSPAGVIYPPADPSVGCCVGVGGSARSTGGQQPRMSGRWYSALHR